jgi:hypothetical protein
VYKYYPCQVRWQQADGFLLWVDKPEPEREALWVDRQSKVPVFETKDELISFAHAQGFKLEKLDAETTDLDYVIAWSSNPGARPIKECLHVWSLFDDLSAGVGELFIGNKKGHSRNRVFDLLYDSFFWNPTVPPKWQPKDVELLGRILNQGLALWEKHTYWHGK